MFGISWKIKCFNLLLHSSYRNLEIIDDFLNKYVKYSKTNLTNFGELVNITFAIMSSFFNFFKIFRWFERVHTVAALRLTRMPLVVSFIEL